MKLPVSDRQWHRCLLSAGSSIRSRKSECIWPEEGEEVGKQNSAHSQSLHDCYRQTWMRQTQRSALQKEAGLPGRMHRLKSYDIYLRSSVVDNLWKIQRSLKIHGQMPYETQFKRGDCRETELHTINVYHCNEAYSCMQVSYPVLFRT